MMPDIIDKREKLPGQVISINAASRLRLQKRLDEIDITVDCLTNKKWHPAAEISINNNQNIHIDDDGNLTIGDITLKAGDNPGWWQVASKSADADIRIKTEGRVEYSPAFPAAYTTNDLAKIGIYTPQSIIRYDDGIFYNSPGAMDIHFVVTTDKDDIRRELLHYAATDIKNPVDDVLACCDFKTGLIDSVLNEIINKYDDIIEIADTICWHQSLQTGGFYPPWDKYSAHMPALLLKAFKKSGLCEYGCRALLALSYLNASGETAIGLTKTDSVILRSLQSLLSCENI